MAATSAAASPAATLVRLTRTLYRRVGFVEVAERDVRAHTHGRHEAGRQRSRHVDPGGAATATATTTTTTTASRRGRRAGQASTPTRGGRGRVGGESVLAQLPHYGASAAPLDATVTFQPNVQLASLDEPDGKGAGGSSSSNNNGSMVSTLLSGGGLTSLTMSDVAKGAVRGSLGVLKAPLTVGRAVSGAVLDATGVTNAMRNSMESAFRRAFPQLAGEAMIDSFGCAWQDGALPTQGNLFITPHWLCFQGTVAAAQFAVEYDEIKDIKKAKVAKVFDTALEVATHVGDTYVLVNFLQRDQAYTTLMQQWLK